MERRSRLEIENSESKLIRDSLQENQDIRNNDNNICENNNDKQKLSICQNLKQKLHNSSWYYLIILSYRFKNIKHQDLSSISICLQFKWIFPFYLALGWLFLIVGVGIVVSAKGVKFIEINYSNL